MISTVVSTNGTTRHATCLQIKFTPDPTVLVFFPQDRDASILNYVLWKQKQRYKDSMTKQQDTYLVFANLFKAYWIRDVFLKSKILGNSRTIRWIR
jgi:hypothetical protein